MTQQQMDNISQVVADNGFIEWTLVAFDESRDYQVFSYFTDAEIMPIFRAVLISMLKRMDNLPCMTQHPSYIFFAISQGIALMPALFPLILLFQYSINHLG